MVGATPDERPALKEEPVSQGAESAPRRPPSPLACWLHPLCFALFPMLSLYAANTDQAPYPDVFRPLLATLAGALILAALLRLALRNSQRAAITLTAILFLFFSFGHMTDLAYRWGWIRQVYSAQASLVYPLLAPLALWCIVLAGVIFLVLRSKRDLSVFTSILNVVGIVLVVVPAGTIVQRSFEDHGLIGPTRDKNAAPDPISMELAHLKPSLAPTPATPDIYYIILDAYGRADVLKRFYGFDNQPFLNGLRSRGFFVADRARPNYGQTIESISSSLNMTYLDRVAAKVGPNSLSYAPLMAMVDHNAVAAFLRKREYRFLAITTGFDLTVPESADMLLGDESVDRVRTLTPFDALALDITPLAILPQKEITLYDAHREQLIEGFHDLGELPRLPFRKFVFAHVLAPHPPFVFGPNGEAVDPRRPYSISDGSDYMHRGTPKDYAHGYIDQLQYLNTLVLRAIDSIYAGSKVRPVIIVQGDHGPRMYVDWDSLEHTDVRETYGNLNAFELPDGTAPQVFYDSITPVNSFRLLLDHYFQADYARLPDRSYYATLHEPYKFVDVTERLPASLEPQ